VELSEVLRRRRMVRAFTPGRTVDGASLDRVLDAARRTPSAGNAQGLDLVVLQTPEVTVRYWDVALPAGPARDGFRWQGLLHAPVLVLPVVSPAAYAARYAEPDKAGTGLGHPEAWPVPYWLVDGGMAVLALLLAAVDEGLGAVFFGLFDRERPVLAALGVPDDRRGLGVVALGHPAPDEPGASARRPRRPLDEVVHRGRW
jgi:nitroreductase